MKTQKLEYTHGGKTFVSDLAWDETVGGPRPGILVFPEAFGLNEHARVRAQRLAQLGYVALAVDIYGDGAVFNEMPALLPHIQALYGDRTLWRARARAALDALTAQAQVDAAKTAAIGFCFGGATCLELARSGAALRAVVTFHAGLVPELPQDAGQVRAKVLVCHGADDPIVKKEAMEAVMSELRRDKVDWQFVYYGNAVHSFTNPQADERNAPGMAYDRRTEDRSWAAMRTLFDETFK